MKQITRKDAEISMGLVSALVILSLTDLEDAIFVMSSVEDIIRAPGGTLISNLPL
jgi:hypothetical protein